MNKEAASAGFHQSSTNNAIAFTLGPHDLSALAYIFALLSQSRNQNIYWQCTPSGPRMQQLLHLVPGGLGRPQAGSYGPFAIKGHHHCASPAHGSRETSRTIELLVTRPETAQTSRQPLGPQGHGQGQPRQGLYQVIWTESRMFSSSQCCVLSKRCNRFPALAPFLCKIHAT